MESPLAQDSVIVAQEDSTSVEPGAREVMSTPPSVTDDAPLPSGNSQELNCHNETSQNPSRMGSSATKTLGISQEENSNETKADNDLNNPRPVCKDCEGDASKESNSLPVSRKRPATDFLPINAEIKKIGVEISEEQAQQLKNEVRRLSPIHVSLRERTLGEISLISEPRIFVEQDRFPNKEDGELSNSASEDETLETDGTKQEDCKGSSGQLGDESRVGCCDAVDGASVDKQSVPTAESGENASEHKAMVFVLSRVDRSENSKVGGASKVCDDLEESDILEKKVDSEEREQELHGEPKNSSRTLTLGSCSHLENRVTARSDIFTVEKMNKNEELSVGFASPRKLVQIFEKNKEFQGVSKAVIQKIEDHEELVFASATLGLDEIHPEEVGQNSLGLENIGASFQSQESHDTEETETGSDSSEVTTSMTKVRFEDGDHAIADQIRCSENEPLICDDIPPEIMTRLEPERPEAFTEDSAESLALAAGSRDEVRSDGSDSGLGSEIPGDPGPVPAPESDSETSFLDRIPDEILSDKDKAVNQLETFAPTISGQCTPQSSLPTFRSPPKSNLKRRLVDCMEGEPNVKRINTDEPMKKKRNIQFDAVTVYYFPRAQGFTCVPSQGGSTLGMSATHTHAERFSLTEHATEQRRLHRARLAQLRTERAANCVTEAASSSEDPSDDTDEEPSDPEELDIDSYYFLQPVPTWQRRALLRSAGVRRIEAAEKDECRDIRASREHCGCGCKGYCDPESCPCSRANVKCQVDRAGFPCGCSRDGCANSSGRIEFNPVRVRTHFIHTLMRLELEKKQRDEEHTEQDLVDTHHSGRGPLREVISMGSVIESPVEACINGGGFTTLHYESHETVGPSCQQDVAVVREESLDLYAIRDDCYPSEDTVDTSQNAQRKLHPEFHQTFQTFQGHPTPPVAFQQNAYTDYQSYQNIPSTSRAPFQPQFPVATNSGFSHHYGGYPADGSMPPNCQTHQGQHATGYETPFPQEEAAASQYTNLSSVPSTNAVVQQMGKLEPFSELLAGRYSYYGELDPQNHGNYHASGVKIETEKGEITGPSAENSEECDENFGEIIKKSMVETVSA
ncbi:uncharacterized protein LOC117167467 isoform X2 [Belonocnema kinseyi]|nr:uncharacterized protein LOC117167467 isoform X2 [Belonocnema kinseyi]